MTLRQKVGQMFMCSFLGANLSPAVQAFVQRWQPGGVILFGNNVWSPTQVSSLTNGLQQASRQPLLISTDQEGGEVARITSLGYVLPAESVYGTQDNHTQVYLDARRIGRQLNSIGINMNLAPVLDVLSDSNSPIGSRSFGPYASVDAELGRAAIRGYQAGGVAATAKHFLGLGSTSVNAESGLPYVSLTPAQLEAQLKPFRAAVKAHVDAIMVTHVLLQGVTGPGVPASMSSRVIRGMIRQGLGYRGVIMTDSLSMGAVAGFSSTQAAVSAIRAGEDIVLVGGGGTDATTIVESDVDAIVKAVESGEISAQRINQSAGRIIALKIKLGLYN